MKIQVIFLQFSKIAKSDSAWILSCSVFHVQRQCLDLHFGGSWVTIISAGGLNYIKYVERNNN